MKLRLIKQTTINGKKFSPGTTIEVASKLGKKLLNKQSAVPIDKTDEDVELERHQID